MFVACLLGQHAPLGVDVSLGRQAHLATFLGGEVDRPAHVAIVKTGAGRPMRPVYGEISLQAVEQFRGRTKAHGLPALGRGMRWGKGCQGAGVGLVQQDPGQFLPIALVGGRCRLCLR